MNYSSSKADQPPKSKVERNHKNGKTTKEKRLKGHSHQKLKIDQWNRRGPIGWYEKRRLNKMNDHEQKGHNLRMLEAYVTTISPLRELKEKKANIKCQWCNKMGHSVRNCRKFRKNKNHETPFTNPLNVTSDDGNPTNTPPPYSEKSTNDENYDPCPLEMNDSIPRSCRRLFTVYLFVSKSCNEVCDSIYVTKARK